jgi:hypothetical protein
VDLSTCFNSRTASFLVQLQKGFRQKKVIGAIIRGDFNGGAQELQGLIQVAHR